MYDLTGTWVHVSTICRTVQRLGLRKCSWWLFSVAWKCRHDSWLKFLCLLVWVDETGSNRRNSVQTHGYSLKGMRAVSHQLLVGGKQINAIGVMSMQGMGDAYIVKKNVNGDVFERFVRTSLLPVLKPFNGTNSHSVVVMDNASIHHLDKNCTDDCWSWCFSQISSPLLPRIKYDKTRIF